MARFAFRTAQKESEEIAGCQRDCFRAPEGAGHERTDMDRNNDSQERAQDHEVGFVNRLSLSRNLA